ncbi:MAG TPA: erythromycin esterase family protein [Saprospiraceae bacterium]|nr:erythromycin esterase family protein [Saprospiraceae bacterium]
MLKPILPAIFALLFSVLSGISALAQQPLNLDFERLSVEGMARPWGWAVFMRPEGCTASLDSTDTFRGQYSLRFSNEGEGEQSMGYWLSPYELAGQKITLSGWVKTNKADGFAQLSLSAYGDNGLISEARSEAFKGVAGWQPFELEFSESSPAHSFFLILSNSGGGDAWFDGFQLSVNGKEKNSVEVADDFSREQLEWVQANSSSIGSFQPVKMGETPDFSSLEPFRQAVGDARVIALGESTHGTSEFFQLKHRLLQYAVQELNVRVFAIEANQLEVEKVNRYVCDGKGKATEVIKAMFKVWNTAEMLELIEWLRAYNLQHPASKVEFVGFDLQDPSLPMDSLSHFLAGWAPGLRPLVDSLQHPYREAWRAQYYPQAADSVRAIWKENAEQVLALMSGHEQAWMQRALTTADKKRVAWALQNARVAFQAADIAYDQTVSRRDTFMAENIRWIQSMREPGLRILVWAHDSHIARGDAPDNRLNYFGGNGMGRYLSKLYGTDYRAFGLFTYEGQYSATISFYNHTVVPVDAMTAPRGSFDEALHRLAQEAGVNALFLNLAPALALEDNGWLLQPRPVRFVGYAAADFDYGAVMAVPYQFDGLFFVDKSGASKMLR